MTSSNVIRNICLGKRAVLTGIICLCAALVFYILQDVPFDKRIAHVLLTGSAAHFTCYLLFRRFTGDPQRGIVILSLTGIGVLTFMTHFTGGIVSPLSGLYFAILASEVACGVTFSITIYAALTSYLGVVLGEALGFLDVKLELAKTIYANPVVTAVIVVPIIFYMGITGHIGKVVLIKLKLEADEENRKHQGIIKKLSELDSYAHIGLLTHRIVHDLRGPLASISGYIELEHLSPDKTDAEKAALLDLSAMVMKMSDSLNNITRFGRVMESAKERIKVEDFFRSLIAMFGFYKDAHKIEFRQNYPAEGDLSVMAVRHDLQQAYFNILKNAVEAVKNNAGDKIVEVSMRRSAGTLELEIASNGRHIPPEILATIFQKAVTFKPDGTGVGLLITRELLVKNDISIEIRNTGTAGVLVVTRMPLVDSVRIL
jgi:signal transduction histidine kinase